MADFDPFSRDEFWRAQNPGLSAARGFLWAVCLSAGLWALIGARCVVLRALKALRGSGSPFRVVGRADVARSHVDVANRINCYATSEEPRL